MTRIFIATRRMWRTLVETRRRANAVKAWWKGFIAECEAAENPMRWH